MELKFTWQRVNLFGLFVIKLFFRSLGIVLLVFGALTWWPYALGATLIALRENVVFLTWDRLQLFHHLLNPTVIAVLGGYISFFFSRRYTFGYCRHLLSSARLVISMGMGGLAMSIASLFSGMGMELAPKRRRWVMAILWVSLAISFISTILTATFIRSADGSALQWLGILGFVGVMGLVAVLFIAIEPGFLMHTLCFIGIVFAMCPAQIGIIKLDVYPLIWEKDDSMYASILDHFRYLKDPSVFISKSQSFNRYVAKPGTVIVLATQRFWTLDRFPPGHGQTMGQVIRNATPDSVGMIIDRTFSPHLPGDLLAAKPEDVETVVVVGSLRHISGQFGSFYVIPFLVFTWPEGHLVGSGNVSNAPPLWSGYLAKEEVVEGAKRIEKVLRGQAHQDTPADPNAPRLLAAPPAKMTDSP